MHTLEEFIENYYDSDVYYEEVVDRRLKESLEDGSLDIEIQDLKDLRVALDYIRKEDDVESALKHLYSKDTEVKEKFARLMLGEL